MDIKDKNENENKVMESINHYMINFLLYIHYHRISQVFDSFGATLTSTNSTQIHMTELTKNLFGVVLFKIIVYFTLHHWNRGRKKTLCHISDYTYFNFSIQIPNTLLEPMIRTQFSNSVAWREAKIFLDEERESLRSAVKIRRLKRMDKRREWKKEDLEEWVPRNTYQTSQMYLPFSFCTRKKLHPLAFIGKVLCRFWCVGPTTNPKKNLTAIQLR